MKTKKKPICAGTQNRPTKIIKVGTSKSSHLQSNTKKYRVQVRYLWSRYEREKKDIPLGSDPATYEAMVKDLADRLGV